MSKAYSVADVLFRLLQNNRNDNREEFVWQMAAEMLTHVKRIFPYASSSTLYSQRFEIDPILPVNVILAGNWMAVDGNISRIETE